MASTSKTIVFIHGMFVNSKTWEPWVAYFEKLGYTCHAPDYLFHDKEIMDIRSTSQAGFGNLTFNDLYEQYVDFINALPELPILIGHSMGGLLVQKLINNDKGIAGISISSAPPVGIITLKWSFLRAILPIINPCMLNTLYRPSLNWFKYAFAHTLSDGEAREAYDTYVIPESRNIPRTSTLWGGFIHFKRKQNPLLMIAWEFDHIIPTSLNQANFNAYKNPENIKEFKVFPGRTHWICGQKNWEEIAGYIENWIKRI